MVRGNKETFIEKARKIHGDEYLYENVEYVNNKTPVEIICKSHGSFWQRPDMHLNGEGCPLCKHRSKKYTQEEFLNECKNVHGDRYGYEKTVYKNIREKIEIICPDHGPFWQIPSYHLSGNGCPLCGNNIKKNNENFISEAKKIHVGYDYSKVNYINNKTKVCIICPKHGEFWQTPKNHLKGCGCPECGRERTRNSLYDSFDSFVEKARKVHGNMYEYPDEKYCGYNVPINITCKKHGQFLQKPTIHLSGCGCPMCASETNISETKLYTFIKKSYPDAVIQYKPDWLKRKNGQQSIDIFIPSLNIGIEYQGEQHFNDKTIYSKNNFEEIRERDIRKYEASEKNGVKLLYFTYLARTVPRNYFQKVFINENDLLNELKKYVDEDNTGNRKDIQAIQDVCRFPDKEHTDDR